MTIEQDLILEDNYARFFKITLSKKMYYITRELSTMFIPGSFIVGYISYDLNKISPPIWLIPLLLCFYALIILFNKSLIKSMFHTNRYYSLFEKDLLMRVNSPFEKNNATYLYVLGLNKDLNTFRVCIFDESGENIKIMNDITKNDIFGYFNQYVPNSKKNNVLDNIKNKI